MSDTTPNPDNRYTDSKVGRMVENYDLSGQGEWLEGAWAGDGVERRSLHDLADEFNQCVLKAAMIEAGIDPLQKAVVNTYEILTDK